MAKSAQAFRTIREVADWLGVAAHVLRFWESKFSQIKPVKRAGGRRYYRPADMQLVGGIKVLLHDRGMTIRGVKKMISDDGLDAVIALSPPIDAVDDNAEIIDVTPDREWEQDAASEDQASEPAATAPAREDAMSTAAPPAEGDAEEEVAPDDLDTSEPESQTGTMPQAAPEPEPDPEPEPKPAPVIADNMPASRPAAVDTASPARATPEGGVLGQLADLAQSNTTLAVHLPALRALRDRMSGTSQSQ